jgi:hypothetical protein
MDWLDAGVQKIDGQRDHERHPLPHREVAPAALLPMTAVVQRHRTAMTRTMLSRPMALAFEDGVLTETCSVLDYGCGRGGDVDRLCQLGLIASGWDPNHRPDADLAPADVVNLGYVINVIEDEAERSEALRQAWSLARSALVVAARPAWEGRDVRGRPHYDGILTAKDTFQKFFEQEELRSYIEATLGTRSVAAAPGVFYVFRDEMTAQAILARRTRCSTDGVGRVADLLYELHRDRLSVLQGFVDARRRLPERGELGIDAETELVETFGSVRAAFALIRRATGSTRWSDVDMGRPSRAERLFDQHRAVLEPLIAFVEERGRLPRPAEMTSASDIADAFGSVRAAFSIVRRVTGGERWKLIEERARRNFLVYLALAAFGGRPRFSDLPADLQLDTRDLFGTYKNAVVEADRLLYGAGNIEAVDHAARTAPVGKLTPEALYVHVAALEELPPLLRVYEGCGQALAGTIDEATIVKLHRQKPQVSYLSYPTFDREPHPALSTVLVARLGALNLTYRDFRESENPPILHRKDTFVAASYSGRDMFARLTAKEEASGLLSSNSIGTLRGWEETLAASGLRLRGHRLVRR